MAQTGVDSHFTKAMCRLVLSDRALQSPSILPKFLTPAISIAKARSELHRSFISYVLSILEDIYLIEIPLYSNTIIACASCSFSGVSGQKIR